MTETRISPEEYQATLEAAKRFTKKDGSPNISKISEALGIARSTVTHRLNNVDLGRYKPPTFPDFVTQGDDTEPVEEIIDRMCRNFQRKQSATSARKWFTIKLKERKPYGLLWFGDPHLDDAGCNWPLLRKHVEIAKQPGVYGANIGDTTNNWVGRLMAKYANQETSRETADRLAEWFMLESEVEWLVWLLGNHDLWNNGASFYKRMGAYQVPVIDWRAQFRIEHPNGSSISIDASHGRKGTSIYNELHSTLREAIMGEVADLYVTGHTHSFALEQLEIPRRDHVCWLMQLRGYKHMDEYALVKGFPEYKTGAAVLAIIDPNKSANPVLQCFEDVGQGADYLSWLRSRT